MIRCHTRAIRFAYSLLGAKMTDDTARAAEILAGHRASIDRLDAILIYTLGERFKHTQAVGELKDLSKRAELDPAFAKKFLRFVIDEVIRHHEHHQKTSGDQ